MNFLNPLISVYFRPKNLEGDMDIPFYREVLWIYCKNLENRLKMFRHRVNIVFIDTDKYVGTSRFGSIYEYRSYIDYAKFKTLNEKEKKRIILDKVFEGFLNLGKENDWDLKIIYDAYQNAIHEIDHFIYQTNFKLNSNRKYKGRITITLNRQLVTFYAEYSHADDEKIYSTTLLDTAEINFSWWRKVKDFGWYDTTRFGLKLLSGELWIISNVNTNEAEEILNPRNHDKRSIKSFLEELKT